MDGAVWAWVSRTTKPRLCAELRKEADGHALDTCSCVQMRAGLWAGSCEVCVGLLLALIKMLSHSVKAKSIKEPGATG